MQLNAGVKRIVRNQCPDQRRLLGTEVLIKNILTEVLIRVQFLSNERSMQSLDDLETLTQLFED